MRRLPTLVVLGALAALAIAVAGCGTDDKVPANAVANVNGTVISKQDFDRLLVVRAKGQAAQTKSKKKNPVPAPGTPEYNALKDAVMQSLLTSAWNNQEAKELDVSVSDTEVKKRFEQEKKQFFPKEAAYQKFLKQTGQTEPQVLQQVKAAIVAQNVQKKLSANQEKITVLQVQDYYNKNKKQFTQPEQRSLLVVVNTSKSKIDAAKKALDGGASFATVAKKYSSDQGSKARGGQISVPKGLTDKNLDKTIFGAKLNTTVGPVKLASGGFLIFEATKQTSPTTQPFNKVQAQIRQTLTSQAQQKSLTGFQDKWKGRTNCGQAFRVQLCKNAPPQPKTPAVPGGLPPGQAAPQQGGQQQAPPPPPAQQGGQQQAPPPPPAQQGGSGGK